MLRLKNIKKDYKVAGGAVSALKGISIDFRENEFVSVLGPSGCGKTTLLNIVGGLDGYSGGDLVINGISTKKYKDSDWDTYRNHRVGFIFQSYNLIPHQSVLSNVELALTLSGVSKKARRKAAIDALTTVGLADQNLLPLRVDGCIVGGEVKVITVFGIKVIANLCSEKLGVQICILCVHDAIVTEVGYTDRHVLQVLITHREIHCGKLCLCRINKVGFNDGIHQRAQGVGVTAQNSQLAVLLV